MSRKDITLTIGESWTIFGVVNDEAGAPVDLTGGSVEMRIASSSALLIKLSSPSDILIDAGSGGTYEVNLDAADPRQDQLQPGYWDYEIDCITAAGAVSVQNAGKVTLVKSLRKAFP